MAVHEEKNPHFFVKTFKWSPVQKIHLHKAVGVPYTIVALLLV